MTSKVLELKTEEDILEANLPEKHIEFLTSILLKNKADFALFGSTPSWFVTNILVVQTISPKHSYALCDYVIKYLKDNDLYSDVKIESSQESGWCAVWISSLDFIIHLMTEERIEYYRMKDLLENKINHDIFSS